MSDLLARLEAAGSDEEREWIVQEANLAGLDESVQEAVWAAAIPHWFDVAFLAMLLGKDEAKVETLWPELVKLSYVEPFPDRGYNVHERTRKLLLDTLWRNDRERFREFSRRAAAYCERQDRDETAWQMEWIYHLLIAEPDRGATELKETGRRWQNPPNFAFDRLDAMIRLISEHADNDRLEDRSHGWTIFWTARLDRIYSRYHAARSRLADVSFSKEVDATLAAHWNLELGDILYRLSDHREARNRYEKALSIYQETEDRLGEANCLEALADVHYALSEYDDARSQYKKAISIYQNIDAQLGKANCVTTLGDIDRVHGEYDAARRRYEEARLIYHKIGARLGETNCIFCLGDVHRALGEYSDARRRYEEALLIYQEIGTRLGEANCIWALGDIHRMLDEFDDARSRYEEARLIYHEIGAQSGEMDVLCGLAEIDCATSHWPEAKEKYREALAYYSATGMAREQALAHTGLGQIACSVGNPVHAHQHYKAALAIYKRIGSPKAADIEATLKDIPLNE